MGILKDIIKGIPTKPPVNSGVSKIKTDVERYERPKPITPWSAVKQVWGGVPKAGVKNEEPWRYALKKAQEKAKPAVVDRSAFANNKKEYKRERAADWIAKELQSGNLKDLKGRFFHYFKYLPRESDPIGKKLALAEKIFGSEKEPIGKILERKTDTPLNIALRNRKFREKIIPVVKAKKDYRGIEQEKINQEILNRFFEGKKN